MPPIMDRDPGRAIAQMILIHKNVLMVLQSSRLSEVLGRLSDSNFRADAIADPFETARQYDIQLPEHSNVYFHEFGDASWSVEVVVTGKGRTTFGFNSATGFFIY